MKQVNIKEKEELNPIEYLKGVLSHFDKQVGNCRKELNNLLQERRQVRELLKLLNGKVNKK